MCSRGGREGSATVPQVWGSQHPLPNKAPAFPQTDGTKSPALPHQASPGRISVSEGL